MNDVDRFRLRFGPYRMPKCKVGKMLRCVIRGEKNVVGISDAPIPWPMTQHDSRKGCGRPYLIVCGDLVRAVRRESARAVAHWWGVNPQTVWQWRKALGVERINEGTRARLGEAIDDGRELHGEAYRHAIGNPERGEKIAASKLGKKRPPHVREAIRRALLGRKATPEACARMSEAQKRRGTWPPPQQGVHGPQRKMRQCGRCRQPRQLRRREERSVPSTIDERRFAPSEAEGVLGRGKMKPSLER